MPDGTQTDIEDTDGLLYTDLNEDSSTSGWDSAPPPVKLDHCELLLDAMDAQLSQLQVQKYKTVSGEHDCSDAAPLRWSQSLSKDTGLGSTTNDTPMSCLDLIHTPTADNNTTSCCTVSHDETHERLDRRRARDKEESRREQVMWRLERLLGDTCMDGGMVGDARPPSDSVCTEDFVRRFREEMVELADGGTQHPDKEDVSDRGPSGPNRQSVLDAETSSKDTVTPPYQSNKPRQRKQGEKCVSDSYEEDILRVSEGAGHQHPHRPGDNVCHGRNHEGNISTSPKARYLAGVPVCSFDTVSIDSDVDTVCTEQVRWHIHKLPGWRSLIQSVTDLNDNQSDCDTHTQEESDPQSTSVQRHTRSLSARKAQRNRRETGRRVCSLSDNDRDTEEDTTDRSERFRPERMKQQLSELRHKREEEEETLKLRRTQLKDVELCLSELRQKKKNAVQELERLTAERAQMEKEKKTLESVLRDSRVEKESVSFQLRRLQMQKESVLLQVRDLEEDLAALSQRKQTPKEGTSMSRNSVIISVLEREEIERQLDAAKAELFAEQRRAREKIESMQEKLEESAEQLHRATEAESSLSERCAALEDKQRQKKEQIEALEVKASELQAELRECKTRASTQEKMLAQKELQLLDIQEQRGALQAERDGLKGELQRLETENSKALQDAQERLQTVMVNKQAEEQKTRTLKEQSLSLTQQIESMQSSIQLKEEEVIKPKRSMREETKKHEEELHKEVHEAVEEERRKWEAEKQEAVQVHCGILEEKNRKSLESMTGELQREKSKAQALQHQVVELKTRVQELESESCAQQRERHTLLAVICKSLKEEHRAELLQSQRHMAQQSQRTVLRLERDLQLAVKESDRLRAMLEERESSHKGITAQMEHRAEQLRAECQQLHRLVEPSAEQLPPSVTVSEALTHLRTLREKLKHFMSHLQQELDSQKQTNEQLREDKERELNIQRRQLRVERDQALNSLKERLIQEHIEELSSLTWAHMSDGGGGGGGGGGGVAASLRKQLKAKDQELRQVQRRMAEWKEQTAARLACKFEEELTAELERCKAKLLRARKAPKIQEHRLSKPERSEGEMALSAKEAVTSLCSPCLHVVDLSASHSPSDVASFKLLRYLQSRVKQLRVENQAYMWSPPPSHTVPLHLSGSYLATLTPGQDRTGLLSDSSLRTVSSEGHEASHSVSECTPMQ